MQPKPTTKSQDIDERQIWEMTFASAELTQLSWEQEWLQCTRCPELVARRRQVVPGYGAPESRLLFLGEAPGEQEDLQGWPFIGPAGELLRSYLWHVAGLHDNEFYLSNIVICRPTIPGDPPLKNREPRAEEIRNCAPRLHGTIYEIDPLLIVALGGTALRALTGDAVAITKARGKMFHTTIPGVVSGVTYPVLATYHPSYLRRNMAERTVENSCWAHAGADFKLAVHIYDSLKQAYFAIPIPDREAIRNERKSS